MKRYLAVLLRSLYAWFASTCPKTNMDFNYARRYHHFERDLWLTRYFCSSHKVAIDVGSNQGIYSRYLAKFSKVVHCFECNTEIRDELKRILPKNAILHGTALSDREGTAYLRYQDSNTGIGTIEIMNNLEPFEEATISKLKVDTTTLDSYSFNGVAFVKIDVEGHEMSVLRGSEKLLSNEGPALLVEIEERHCNGNTLDVPHYLAELGYSMFYLSTDHGSKLVKITSIAKYADAGIYNYWFLGRHDIKKAEALKLIKCED